MRLPLLCLFAAAAFCACDEISSDERFIEVEGVVPQRVVLLEDFTGQNCVNCPAAHERIEQLVEQYGDALIPVAIHCGGFGVSVTNKRFTGLMQPEGDVYNDRWGIDGWPKGVINRRGGAQNPDEWATTLRTELGREPLLAIDLDASLSDDGKTINVGCTLKPFSDVKDAKLTVWVVEDGIVARQVDANGNRMDDYVHDHVFRAVMTDVNGDAVTLKNAMHVTKEYSVAVRESENEKWNTANLSIVAFVETSDGVGQAARVRLVNE